MYSNSDGIDPFSFLLWLCPRSATAFARRRFALSSYLLFLPQANLFVFIVPHM
jgi:hypothetical protein